jgi:phosphate transport system substrate-binding protein
MANKFSFKAFIIAVIAIVILSSQQLYADQLTGMVRIDGSSTVYPITEAVVEEFRALQPKIKVTVGISGTGGGMKKFFAQEVDIANASRPIKSVELAEVQKNNIEFIELPVAYDALTVVVNAKNTWADSITVQELKKIWEPEAQGKILKWSQVREGWPDKPIKLFGAGVDSGTYDYFTEAIVGKEHSSRGDFTSSEDDNVLVQGITNDLYALGFFGMAYFEENKTKLKALKVDDDNAANGAGPQAATRENVITGIYAPLARPLFVYVNKQSLKRPEIAALMNFYLESVATLVGEVGYVPLAEPTYVLVRQRLAEQKAGTIYAGSVGHVGVALEELLRK